MPVNSFALAAEWARFYQGLGLQPVPSVAKRPLVPYSHFWDRRFDDDPWLTRKAPSIQLMCGSPWGLAVVDLDGPEAVDHFEAAGFLPTTWTVLSPGGGKHLWFRLPDGFEGRRGGRVWGVWDDSLNEGRGEWRPRMAVELFLDRSLITAPPSVHKNGGRYRFATGLGPHDLKRPALIPDWVLELPVLSRPRRDEAVQLPPRPGKPPPRGGASWREVAESIPAPEKVSLASGWGLRFAARPLRSGSWVSVHDYNREDRHPSARFNLATGAFWRPGEKPLNLFGLAAELGAYRDWREACDDLRQRYAS